MPLTFGQKIRELRKAKGLGQRAVATEVGINFTYLSKIENDKVEAVWFRHDPALFCLSLTLPPARTVDAALGDVQTIFPPARGR